MCANVYQSTKQLEETEHTVIKLSFQTCFEKPKYINVQFFVLSQLLTIHHTLEI